MGTEVRRSNGTQPSGDTALVAEHAWLTLGAVDKAESVVRLTRRLSIDTVLEVGSGTGALLCRLDELDFGSHYYALEPAAGMFAFMMERARSSRLVDGDVATIQTSRLRSMRYDLAIVSHVLEHVDNPAGLLGEVLNVAEHVVVEVPLDGSLAGNIRSAVKSRLTGRPRHDNAAGHIQFFSSRDVDQLVRWCGGEVVDRRLYLPYQRLNQPETQPVTKRAYFRVTTMLAGIVGEDRWARIYHGHLAVLVRRRQDIPVDERTRWTPVYHQESPAPVERASS